MKRAISTLVWISVLLITCSLRAQSESGNDDPSVTTNLGIPVSVALNPTGRYISGGWGVDSGIGYNFDRRNALIGEFMWNTLNPTNAVLQPVRSYWKLSVRIARQEVRNLFHRRRRVVSP